MELEKSGAIIIYCYLTLYYLYKLARFLYCKIIEIKFFFFNKRFDFTKRVRLMKSIILFERYYNIIHSLIKRSLVFNK